MTNKFKEKHGAKPVERQETAAWANIEAEKPLSQVNVPSELQVRNAKEYVNSNEK